jgi:hypothetical protein
LELMPDNTNVVQEIASLASERHQQIGTLSTLQLKYHCRCRSGSSGYPEQIHSRRR